MEWAQLLCTERIGRGKRPAAHDPARSEFRRDSDRITFSTAFRRLQDKTQVFPLADNDYVRTRLTHSLEVASVGRSLGARVGATVCQRHPLDGIHPSDFGDIISAAGLAHDLGNPPFGHSGEEAIRHWFTSSLRGNDAAQDLTVEQRADIARYEGNAQGFRLITRLQKPDNPGGLQLTYATLGAFTKYPCAAHPPPTRPAGVSGKKFGFFQSERAHFESVASQCGLIRPQPGAAQWKRHPLAFLVEAADDICYRLIDFEDGFRLGHLSYEEVHDAMLALIDEPRRPRRLAEAHSDGRRVQILRDLAIGCAIDQCARIFLQNEAELLAGTFDQPLIEAVECRDAWKKIETRSIETIYATPRGVEIEAAGFEVLGGLLDTFVPALSDVSTSTARRSSRSGKLVQLLPPETRLPEADPYLRLLKVLDFVSGMTDRYAVTLYKKVRGISLPGQ